jgi:hypothetical protein
MPTFLGHLAPSRVDGVIPDQTQWPPSLQSQLDARESVHVSDNHVNSFEISRYLRDAHQSGPESLGNFVNMYHKIPFAFLKKSVDCSETAVLLDLEKSCNLCNWAPPEIYYVERITELRTRAYARAGNLRDNTIAKYKPVLNNYLQSRRFPAPLEGRGRH